MASVLLLASSSFAGPKVDPSLTKYIDGTYQGSPDQMITVIAVFHDKLKRPNFRKRNASYLQVRKWMRKNAQESQRDLRAQLRSTSQIKFKSLWLMNSMLIRIPVKSLKVLAKNNELRALYKNHKIKLIEPVGQNRGSRWDRSDLTWGLEKIGIADVRKNWPELTGKGINVGVIDTGIDGEHPDLKGRVTAFYDVINKKQQAYDDHGHGTHCSGTIGGGDTSGTSIGVAPEVTFTGVKVLSGSGSGSWAGVLDGMNWVADPDQNPDTNDHPALVSNSWGGGSPSGDPADNPLCKAIEGWVNLGMLPVFANGNSGPGEGSVGLPAGCPLAFAVGATDVNDQIARFSSRGPAVWSTGSLQKPQVSAPGVDVKSSTPGGGYNTWSGTSMATPHVAGLAALVVQSAGGKIDMKELASLLMNKSTDLGDDGSDNAFGAGRIDAFKTLSSSMRRR